MHEKELELVKVKEQKKLSEVLEILNETGFQIVVVCNSQDQVLGVVTDGDIRRSLIETSDLEKNISKVLNKEFIFKQEGITKDEILNIMRQKKIAQLLILDGEKKLKDIILLNDLVRDSEKDIEEVPILLMAGGFGKRLHPLTKSRPKPMLEVSGIPVLELIIDQAKQFGFKDFFISTYFEADQIEDYFGDGAQKDIKIEYLHESEPMGTAGCLKIFPDSDKFHNLIAINGDVLSTINLRDFLHFHNKLSNDITIAANTYSHQIPYGVLRNEGYKVKEIIEKPTIDEFVSAGIYAINMDIVRNLNSTKEPLDMPDIISKNLKKDKKINLFPIHEYWLDIGNINDFKKAQEEFIHKLKK